MTGNRWIVSQGGVRVPLLVKWPEKIKGATVSDKMSGFEDWLVSFHELIEAKAPLSSYHDGRSLGPHLLGKPSGKRKFLYREFSGYGGQQAVWMAKWKGIRQNIIRKKKASLKIELYDLSMDESESRDLASRYPDIVSKIENIMENEHIPSSEFPMKGID